MPAGTAPLPRCIRNRELIEKNMTLTQRPLLLSLALLALMPALSYAEPPKDISQGEMDVAQQMIRQHCTAQATKQSGDPDQPDVGVYQSCVKPYVDAINDMVKDQQDPAVSVGLWSDCRRNSNFAQTGNFPGWASCIAQRSQSK